MVTTTVSPSPLDDWLDEEDAAPEIGLRPSTLTAYRKAGKGPKYSVVGRKFKYHRQNIHAWIEAGGTRAFEAADAEQPVAKAKPAKRRTAAGELR